MITMSNTLTYRERFALTLAHKDTDRVPMDLASTDMTGIDGGPRRLAPLLGIKPGTSDAETDEAVLCALDTDIRDVGGILRPASPLARRISDTEIVNEWGITSRWNGHHYEMVGRPLEGATLEDLEKYPWPDPEKIDRTHIARLAERARHLREQTPYVVCGRHPYYGILELGCWMCGFDDFLYRLAGEPDFVHRFFEIILRYQKRVNGIYYGAVGPYLHFTTSGDDFGTQTGPFMSPEMFRSLVIPYFTERIRHIHEFTGAEFFHHTCGAVHPLIPDLIAAGVRILNPIQPRAAGMEPERLKRDFGDKLVFYGGVDTQELLPRGTPAEVEAATRGLIGVLSRNGGYILSAAHTFQADVPPENVIAMYRAGAT
ncbi:MAG: methyltransferase [Verrucomicrobia bacterium]|nr:methyltransferase [Verrucomicrobiota bacterium]